MPSFNLEQSMVPDTNGAPPLEVEAVKEPAEARVNTLLTVGCVAVRKQDLALVLTNPERYHNIGPDFHSYGTHPQAA